MEIYDEVRHEIKARALAHMIRSVNQAPAEEEPFPHFIFHNVFPADIYQEMQQLLPGSGLYEAFAYEKHATEGQSNRGRFSLTDQSINRMNGRQRSLWLAVRDALGAPEFKAAVFERLREGLTFRFGSVRDVGALPAFPLPELFRETQGYSIKPHPDTRKKVVTMQIALPQDNLQENLGTQFYRRSLNPKHFLREPRGFEVVKQAPFLPNVGYAFSVINAMTLKSWHGRTTLEGDTGVRNTILNIWYTEAAQANPDLVKQYYRRAA